MASTRAYTQGAARGLGAEALRHAGLIAQVLDTADDNQGAADIAQMLAVTAGMWVAVVSCHTLTLEGGTMTVDVGDGVDGDAYMDGINLNTGTVPVVNSSVSPWTDATDAGNVEVTTPTQLFGMVGGKLYTADDTIDVLFNNAADLVKIRLTAFVVNLLGNAISERSL
jgi:hypothetical protein